MIRLRHVGKRCDGGPELRREFRLPLLSAVMRRIGFVLAAAAAMWAVGLVWFAVAPAAEEDRRPSDAIVVLTGGSLRLKSGFELLREGKGRTLFVSGVNQEVRLSDLLRLAGNAPAWAVCCVVLGYEADNTRGNALETARWMRQQGYRSLRLVTAWYHMRRSLLEFERAMPHIRIIPHPVFPARVKREYWWAWPGTALLLVGEYDKYLAALCRPLLEGLQPGGGGGSVALSPVRSRQ